MGKNMDKNMYRRDCGSKEVIYILSGMMTDLLTRPILTQAVTRILSMQLK